MDTAILGTDHQARLFQKTAKWFMIATRLRLKQSASPPYPVDVLAGQTSAGALDEPGREKRRRYDPLSI